MSGLQACDGAIIGLCRVCAGRKGKANVFAAKYREFVEREDLVDYRAEAERSRKLAAEFLAAARRWPEDQDVLIGAAVAAQKMAKAIEALVQYLKL